MKMYHTALAHTAMIILSSIVVSVSLRSLRCNHVTTRASSWLVNAVRISAKVQFCRLTLHSRLVWTHLKSVHASASLTCVWEPPRARAAAGTVSADQNRDAAEAAGFGHDGLQVAVGAVRVGAAPRPRLWIHGLVLGAALEAVPRLTARGTSDGFRGTDSSHTQVIRYEGRSPEDLPSLLDAVTHLVLLNPGKHVAYCIYVFGRCFYPKQLQRCMHSQGIEPTTCTSLVHENDPH